MIILPDNDEPGSKYSASVARDISNVTSSLKIVRLPNLDTSEDVYDFLDKFSCDEFKTIVAETELYVEPSFEIASPVQNESTFPVDDLPSLIKEALILFSKTSDGSQIGCATAMFAVLSALCGGQFRFQNNWLTNYYLLIGPTGIGRKTTIQNFVKKLLEQILNQRDDLRKQILRHEEKIDLITYSAIEDYTTFSVEGLEEAIKGEGVSLLLTPPEYKSILSLNKRANQANTIPVLTSMYDGGVINTRLRERKITAKNYSMSILAASTKEWLDEMFKSENISGGFLNRHLTCYCEPSLEYKSRVEEITEGEWQLLASKVSEVIPKRKSFEVKDGGVKIEYDFVSLNFKDDEAIQIHDDYCRKSHSEMLAHADKPGFHNEIRAREETHAKKIAALYTICNNQREVDSSAIKFGINWAKASSEVFLKITAKKEDVSLNGYEEAKKLYRVILKIYRTSLRPVKRSEITRHTGGKQDKNNELLIELEKIGYISKIDNCYIPEHPNW